MKATSPLPSIDHDPVRGRLQIGGSSYLLVRPETLSPLLQSPDREVQKLLVEGGREGGAAAARAFLVRGQGGRTGFEALLASGGGLGWGRFEVVQIGEDLIEVVLKNSPFAEVGARGSAPVCHPVRGVLEGMASTFRGGEWTASETGCAACGNDCCRFEIHRGSGEAGG